MLATGDTRATYMLLVCVLPESSPSASSPVLVDVYKGDVTGWRAQLPNSYIDTVHTAALDSNFQVVISQVSHYLCTAFHFLWFLAHFLGTGCFLVTSSRKLNSGALKLPALGSTALSHCHLQVRCYLQLMGSLSPLGMSSEAFKIWSQ